MHHFAEDNNLLHNNESPEMLNKLINYNMQNWTKWLNANIITLNIAKTESVIFKPKRKKLELKFKVKSNGKELFPTNSVKYLSAKAD